MSGGSGRGPVGIDTNQPIVDDGTAAVCSMPQPGSQGHADAGALSRAGSVTSRDGEREFHIAFEALQSLLTNAGLAGTVDGAARAKYDALARRYRDDVLAKVRARELTWQQAAEEARGLRDDIMQQIRRRSTPVGRAVAESLKPESPALNRLIAKKTLEVFGPNADFTRLAANEQRRVFAAIVESSGKSNPIITARMKTVSRAGRGLLFLSIGISVYTVATAEDKLEAAGHEGAVTAAGIGGGAAGGAIAGLMCGPGAPVCVTVGAFVGGALAAMGLDLVWSN